MSTVETRYCYRHPDRETGLSCSECGRPICADCANFGPVGVRCPDHASVRPRSPAARIKPPQVRRAPGIALATGTAPVTYTLIALNVLIYLIGASQGGSLNQAGASIYRQGSLYNHMVLYGPFVPHDGWYRLVTAMFLHESLLHIGFNMYALFVIGRVVEQYLGTVALHRPLLRLGPRRFRRSAPPDADDTGSRRVGRDLRDPRRDDDPRVAVDRQPSRSSGGPWS